MKGNTKKKAEENREGDNKKEADSIEEAKKNGTKTGKMKKTRREGINAEDNNEETDDKE